MTETSVIGELLGSGRIAEVFAYGAHVLKLYRSPAAKPQAFMEAAILGLVGAHDLPVPAVYQAGAFAGRWGLVMGRAPDTTLAGMAEGGPEDVAAMIDEMVRLQISIHAIREARLRPLKQRLADNISSTPMLEGPLQKQLLVGLAAMPDGDRICHGDFHPFNIMGRPGATMVVDWPDATRGPPAADACRTYLLLRARVLDLAELYLAHYAEAAHAGRDEILAWLPYVAAARLSENVPEEATSLVEMAAAGIAN